MPANRANAGLFKKGQSGNPNGRPKDTIAPLAREKSLEAFNTLLALLKSEDENIRLKASLAIIERGFGKPIQPVEGGGDTHNHITYVWNSTEKRESDSRSVFAASAPEGDPLLNGQI